MDNKRQSYCHHCQNYFVPPSNTITMICRRCERAGHTYWVSECPICKNPKDNDVNKLKPILKKAA